jgi:acid phosphatase class B
LIYIAIFFWYSINILFIETQNFLKKSKVIYERTVIIREIAKDRLFSAHTRRGDMMIGLTSSTEGWGRILGTEKFLLLGIYVFDPITIPQYLFGSNFRNTVNEEVGPDVR